jgi:D-lyxose ketol-isomerase
MKRSETNKIIERAIVFFRENKFPLPPFAFWTIGQWKKKKNCKEIFESRLGWDVTDFGLGDFKKYGRTIFTLRNNFGRPYAQKVMYLAKGQKSPWHYHKVKTEDIINQGGGVIRVQFKSKSINLKPGESVCIKPGTLHQFYATKTAVVSMEISSVNNDLNDNYWQRKVRRYPEIVEDEEPKYLLCWEYEKQLGVG